MKCLVLFSFNPSFHKASKNPNFGYPNPSLSVLWLQKLYIKAKVKIWKRSHNKSDFKYNIHYTYIHISNFYYLVVLMDLCKKIKIGMYMHHNQQCLEHILDSAHPLNYYPLFSLLSSRVSLTKKNWPCISPEMPIGYPITKHILVLLYDAYGKWYSIF